jgi:acyl-CoA thioester hydrolase
MSNQVGAPKPAAGPAEPAAQASRRARVRVRYAETDRMGVVYYANYLVWFEVGRTEWLRETGWSYREMEHDGVSLPVIEAHCEYRQSARYDDDLEIVTRATLLSPVRIRFDYEIVRAQDHALAAAGYTVHAAVDSASRPCRLPARVRALLASAASKRLHD